MRQGLFTKDAPFKNVEEYTTWWIEKKGLVDLMEGTEQTNELLYNLFLKPVPLHTIRDMAVNMEDTIIDELDNRQYLHLEESFIESLQRMEVK